jgi:DNA replication protein DnaC
MKLALRKEPVVRYLPTLARSVDQIGAQLRKTIGACVEGRAKWPLVVFGPAGVGKTSAALCLLDHSSGFYYTASTLAEELIRAQQGLLLTPELRRQVSPTELWKEIREAQVCVLDELCAREKVSDHHYECVKRMIDERYGRPLVVCSNLKIDQIGLLYDDRVASRLAGGTVLTLDGKDRRSQ